MKIQSCLGTGLALAGLTLIPLGHADMVSDWNATLSAAINASTDPPPLQGRKAAIVQVAVFDAVNGIAHTYHPYYP